MISRVPVCLTIPMHNAYSVDIQNVTAIASAKSHGCEPYDLDEWKGGILSSFTISKISHFPIFPIFIHILHILHIESLTINSIKPVNPLCHLCSLSVRGSHSISARLKKEP